MIRNKVVVGWGQGAEIRKRDWGSEIMGKESKIRERDGRDWRNGIGDQALTTRIGIRASGIGDWILGIRHQGSKIRCQGSGTEDGDWG